MKDQVDERVKLDRRRRLMAAQKQVARRLWSRWIGREVDVRIDAEASGRPGFHVGRLEQQGYEVDGVTTVRAADGTPVPPVGSRARVRITRVRDYDLEGEVMR